MSQSVAVVVEVGEGPMLEVRKRVESVMVSLNLIHSCWCVNWIDAGLPILRRN